MLKGCDMAITGTSGDDIPPSTDANDAIYGEGGNDVIYGEGGGDYLFGEKGKDTLIGGAGDDVIVGELGAGFPPIAVFRFAGPPLCGLGSGATLWRTSVPARWQSSRPPPAASCAAVSAASRSLPRAGSKLSCGDVMDYVKLNSIPSSHCALG